MNLLIDLAEKKHNNTNMLNKRIYLDHAATTKLDENVLSEMMPFMKNKFGNASSMHYFGQKTASAVDWAREIVAKHLDCDTDEVIFTSGATESNNIALIGCVDYFWMHNKEKPHIIISNIEHPAVLETALSLEKQGRCELSFLKVNSEGVVFEKELNDYIRENTILVSVMLVNNEIGTIQPIAEIGKLIKKINENRKNKIFFHTDAVQAMNYLKCKVNSLNVDLLSFSGHKIYGPKGVGVLYKRKSAKIMPHTFGGHQEFKFRPGTLNTPGIVGLAKAVELLQKDQKKESDKLEFLRTKLETMVLEEIPNSRLNGHKLKRIPSCVNFSFPGTEGESVLMMLDMEGIAVSTGSACASGALEPSHVLTALGLPPEISHASVRVSLGRENTEKDIKTFVRILKPIIARLREMAPHK